MNTEFERRLKIALSDKYPHAPIPDPAAVRQNVVASRAVAARRRRSWMPVGAATAVAALAAAIAVYAAPANDESAVPVAATRSSEQPSAPSHLTTAPATTATAQRSISATEESLPAQCPPPREPGSADAPESVRQLGADWFGHDDLWVNAPQEATDAGVKFWTVTLDNHGKFTKDKGAPGFMAQRIGSAETAQNEQTAFSVATVAGETVYFWPTTVDVLRSGTWLITETLGETTLQFCVKVR